jgi:hypothetical protein
MRGIITVGLCGALALGCAAAAQPAPRPYVFGWPFEDPTRLEPRGGTTRGAPVVLATAPAPAWQEIHAPGLAPRERDRAAILALAGEFRTSFDFLETVLYEPGAGPARPYRSWGTERIAVLEERPDFVSLQHILVMFTVDDDGDIQGPFVQKHWRQDWQYQPERRLSYLGDGKFGLREVAPDERRGAWSQTIYEVDDGPRFASVGRWDHDAQRSRWRGSVVWRPLPRREHTARSDYQVLAGDTRLTVLPTGWVHEQENEKLVLPAPAGGSPASRAREIGISRYERIESFDFSAADAYWAATAPFWSAVREAWHARVASGVDFQVADACEGEPGFAAFFAMAARLERGEQPGDAAIAAEARRIVSCLVDRP